MLPLVFWTVCDSLSAALLQRSSQASSFVPFCAALPFWTANASDALLHSAPSGSLDTAATKEASLTRLAARFRDAKTCGALLFHCETGFHRSLCIALALAISVGGGFPSLTVKS